MLLVDDSIPSAGLSGLDTTLIVGVDSGLGRDLLELIEKSLACATTCALHLSEDDSDQTDRRPYVQVMTRPHYVVIHYTSLQQFLACRSAVFEVDLYAWNKCADRPKKTSAYPYWSPATKLLSRRSAAFLFGLCVDRSLFSTVIAQET